MDYAEVLAKLEKLRSLMERSWGSPGLPADEWAQIAMLYGECEEVITRIVGIAKVDVDKVTYPNLIEAGYLSGRTFHQGAGHSQLLKVIGRVRQLAAGSHPPVDQPQYRDVVDTLWRFRECCQFLKDPPDCEKTIQDLVWIMLRSRFDRVAREEALPAFGIKNYKPDFGLPDVGTLIEVKYIGQNSALGRIQDELLADVPGYLKNSGLYVCIAILVYDAAHKLRDHRAFVEDLKSVEGITDVLVVPGFG